MTRRSHKKTLYNNVFERNTSLISRTARGKPPDVELVYEDFCRTRSHKALYKTAVLTLLCAFVLQPIFAQAEELEPEPAVVETVVQVEQPEPQQPEPVIETEPLDVAVVTSDAEAASASDEQLNTESTEAETSQGVIQQNVTPAADEGDVVSVEPAPVELTDLQENASPIREGEESSVTTADDTPATTTTTETEEVPTPPTSTGGGVGVEEADVESFDGNNATSTQPVIDEDDELDIEENESATSTSEAVVVAVVDSSSEFSFGRDECTLVEDGNYYCQKVNLKQVKQDDLYSALDADGDLEIFVRRDGEEIQVTHNQVDDASPFYDRRSNTIVWHRLINDRYQIISYDIADGQETVITNTRVNNMEPSRSGDITVWQRWVEDNWEIILYENGEETQLTNSIEHDIAPNIRGNLVIWNVRASDGTHSLMTYDVASGVFNDISDPDGVAVSNPRMVVMYDAVYENGDTVMKGFDLVTGELVPLQQTPAELPEELPAPDSTGETRALVAPAPAKPEQDDGDTEPNDTPSDNPDPVTDDTTLDLSQASSTEATSTAERVDEFVLDLRPATTTGTSTTLTEFDLVIEPATTTASSTQN